MLQVSRDHNLKIPKQIENYEPEINSIQDKIAVKEALLTSQNKKIDKQKLKGQIEDDKDFEEISKIPFDSNDLMVITVVKKLGAYVVAITEKSPKKFRGVFVNRMQNYCLDSLEYLIQANFIRMDPIENKKRREYYQKEAIIKLKLLGYIAMLSENVGCILKKQYKQISIQLSEAINLIVAWKKSDDKRINKK
ncbi:MAG: four helix bundle protein [Bacilli bacterium]|nr:four helix bundle protein [Bacilli bacterium]